MSKNQGVYTALKSAVRLRAEYPLPEREFEERENLSLLAFSPYRCITTGACVSPIKLRALVLELRLRFAG